MHSTKMIENSKSYTKKRLQRPLYPCNYCFKAFLGYRNVILLRLSYVIYDMHSFNCFVQYILLFFFLFSADNSSKDGWLYSFA